MAFSGDMLVTNRVEGVVSRCLQLEVDVDVHVVRQTALEFPSSLQHVSASVDRRSEEEALRRGDDLTGTEHLAQGQS